MKKFNIKKKLVYEGRKVQRLLSALFFLIFYLEFGTRVRTTKKDFLIKKKVLYTKIFFLFNLLYFNSFFYLKNLYLCGRFMIIFSFFA